MVLFTGSIEIHREQSFRTIGKVGLSPALILVEKCRSGERVRVVVIYSLRFYITWDRHWGRERNTEYYKPYHNIII